MPSGSGGSSSFQRRIAVSEEVFVKFFLTIDLYLESLVNSDTVLIRISLKQSRAERKPTACSPWWTQILHCWSESFSSLQLRCPKLLFSPCPDKGMMCQGMRGMVTLLFSHYYWRSTFSLVPPSLNCASGPDCMRCELWCSPAGFRQDPHVWGRNTLKQTPNTHR